MWSPAGVGDVDDLVMGICVADCHAATVSGMRPATKRGCLCGHKLGLGCVGTLANVVTPELRQLRYVVEVAQQRNFTRAAEHLHVAQQALSQQVKVVEDQLGVKLFNRTSRGVELTAAGDVFVEEARRVINAAERVVTRTQAAARGQTGTVRIAYTLTSVYDTLPAIVAWLGSAYPALAVHPREVFGGDVQTLLGEGRYDVAVCPRTTFSREYGRQELRWEPFVAALSETHPFAARTQLTLDELAGELFELWPREMAPGFYDAVVATCRDAGFEPRLDEHAAGSTVWGSIAQGRGVGLVVRSLVEQLPRGITLVPLTDPAPVLRIDLIWHAETAGAAAECVQAAGRAVSTARGWLPSVRAT